MGKLVLVIGSGGREHALCWHFVQNKHRVLNTPGSYAIEQEGIECFQNTSTESILELVQSKQIDLVVIGPEAFLAQGLGDQLREQGVEVIGPNKAAARLETSKAFSKDFCKKYNIPSPQAIACKSFGEFAEKISDKVAPFVVKASGLAAGKGVGIFSEKQDALRFAQTQFESHDEVLLEDYISGPEISCFYLVRNQNFIYLGSAQDHKRLLEGDQGPNTGGMGAYSPVAFFDEAVKNKIENSVLKPTLKGLKAEGLDYEGFIFLGLMITDSGPQLIEYNCRMGDPETQCVVINWKSDLVDSFAQLSDSKHEFQLADKAVMNIVLAAKGYPSSPEKGFELQNISANSENLKVFHAGTKGKSGAFFANGGRLLSFVSTGEDLASCRKIALEAASLIEPQNQLHFRRDIGHQAI